MTATEEIRKQYDEYMAFKKSERDRVREEVERQSAARINEKLVELSKAVRSAFALGVPKSHLREATRSYSNAQSWNAVWSAAEDIIEVPEAKVGRPRKTAVTEVGPFKIVTDDPKDQGAKFIEAGAKAKLVVMADPDGVLYAQPIEVPLQRYALRGPWVPDPGAEWFTEDDETGERMILPEYAELAAWGLERIEQEYTKKGA